MGMIFWNNERIFIPNFGKSHTTETSRIITAIIIKKVFGFLTLLLLELSISSNLLTFLFSVFVLKNGRNSHITKRTITKIRIRRNIQIYFLFLVGHCKKLKLLLLKSIFHLFPTIRRKNL